MTTPLLVLTEIQQVQTNKNGILGSMYSLLLTFYTDTRALPRATHPSHMEYFFLEYVKGLRIIIIKVALTLLRRYVTKLVGKSAGIGGAKMIKRIRCIG
jgi:hypothetical protein